MFVALFITLFVYAGPSYARDLGFRYKNGLCQNEKGVAGLNPGYMGQCADFRGTIFGQFNFDDIDLSGSQFSASELQHSTFSRAVLIGVSFEGASLTGVDFTEAMIKRCSFKYSVIKEVIFAKAEIEQADFSEANFSGSTLSYFKARDSRFAKANFTHTKLDFGALSKSNFAGADFKQANLEGTDLSRAVLTGVRLFKANLKMKNLAQTDLSDANLRSVNFTSALIEGVTWTAATYNNRTVLPFPGEQAQRFGMILDNKSESFAEFQNHFYFKVGNAGTMFDKNIYETCKNEGLGVPCNDNPNGPYSDSKCIDVGWRDNGAPMGTLSYFICKTRPDKCPALMDVFQYMGEKYANGSGCGFADGVWCAMGQNHTNKFALCVD